MKKLILFDLDGTLLDTLEDLSEAVNYALELRGLPLHTVDEYRSMVGHGVRNLVQQALEASLQETPGQAGGDVGGAGEAGRHARQDRASDALVDSFLADFKSYYQAHIDVHTRPYPGIPELLTALQEAGVQLAVASNKFQEGTEYLVRRFFPDIHFVAVLGNQPGAPLKPSPEIVQKVLALASNSTSYGGEIAPADALLVGDSPTDMRTAFNGGIDALAVTWGYRSREELSAIIYSDSLGFRLMDSVPALRIELLGFYVSEPLHTPPSVFETPLQQLVYETFASEGIAFERVETDPGITMEDCAHISARIGVDIVKTIFLCNRQQTEFYLYVTSAERPFVTRDFCSALGIPRVSFASAERLWELTGVRVGATTILSGVWPACSGKDDSIPDCPGVHLVMDATVAQREWFACTDGTPTCFVKLRTSDLLERYLNGKNISIIP